MVIVKVQRPLNLPRSDGNVPCLVYQKDRKLMVQQPVEDDVMEILLRGPGKAYFQAELVDGLYRIGRQVHDQNW